MHVFLIFIPVLSRCLFDHEWLLSCICFGISNNFPVRFQNNMDVLRCCTRLKECWSMDIQWFKDVPQQKSRTTGEFRNLECVSDLLSFPRDIPLPKTRIWARHILSTSKVEDVNFEALAMQQREALIISLSFWESETCQGTFDLQHLAHYISSDSGWQ